MNTPEPKPTRRTTACVLVLVIFFSIFELQLFRWQIVQGETFESEAVSHRTDAVELNAVRGEILDKDGNVLVGNHVVYEVVYNALYMQDSQRNQTILEVVDLLEERGEKWRDELPILLDEAGNYSFKPDSDNDIEKLKSRDMLNLADYATADDCMKELAKKYRYEGHSKEDTRTVTSVRYAMTKEGFSIYEPFVMASGVSQETVGIFGEYAAKWSGIETRLSAERYYSDEGKQAPNVLGLTGKVDAEDLEEAEKNGTAYNSETNVGGYKMDDTVGAAGAESAFESDLRGQRGLRTIFSDENGDVTTTAISIQPREGNTVKLTLDSELQRVANMSLEKNIKANTVARDCRAGAAVVLDAKTFGVLAASSYPSYDVEKYLSDSDYRMEILNDEENSPSMDRSRLGIYTPGSIFKPLVAIAGLQEGEIGAGTILKNCDGVFEYADLKLRCTGHHGFATIYEAIPGSCNVFFCQLGLNLTIRKLDAYAEYFGLGEYTGIELGEAKGTMTSPQEYRENHQDAQWTDGLTAQAAIGQADNQFTPMQLATYCATIANGGRRYRTHFLEEVVNYTRDETVRRYEPELLYDAEISPDVIGVVNTAMSMTPTSVWGTAREFAGYPYTVACKTGTAETVSNDDTGPQEHITFICYAPAEDPQVAVAVVLEHGAGGSYAKNVAKDILDQYFGLYTWDEDGNRYNQSGDMVDDAGMVIKTAEELARENATPTPSGPASSGEPAGTEPSHTSDPGDTGDPDEPAATPWPGRGSGIPDRIFTGSIDEPGTEPDSTPEAGEFEPTPEPDLSLPFYYGANGKSATPSPTPENGGEDGEGDGAGDEGAEPESG